MCTAWHGTSRGAGYGSLSGHIKNVLSEFFKRRNLSTLPFLASTPTLHTNILSDCPGLSMGPHWWAPCQLGPVILQNSPVSFHDVWREANLQGSTCVCVKIGDSDLPPKMRRETSKITRRRTHMDFIPGSSVHQTRRSCASSGEMTPRPVPGRPKSLLCSGLIP